MNPKTKQLLQRLVNSPEWEAIMSVAEETKTKIGQESVMKDTPDETFKEVYLQEGRMRGVKELIDNIFNTIQ